MEKWTPERIKELFIRLNGGKKRLNSLIANVMRVNSGTASQLCRRDPDGNTIKEPSRGSGVALLNLLETIADSPDVDLFIATLVEKNSGIKKKTRKKEM